MLPKDFRDQLKERLLDLHWKQWASFGVSSHLDRSEEFILDLEALAVSTLTIGLLDERLFEASLEWSRKNRQWLNFNRIKRISKFFSSGQNGDNPVLLSDDVLVSYFQFLKAPRSRLTEGKRHANTGQDKRSDLIANFKFRGVVVEPDVNLPCLRQLYLRSLFGVDARAEMFLSFLAGGKGNSNLISKEIYLEQKNLYRIINHWLAAGILEESPGGGSSAFALRDRDTWLKTLKAQKLPHYVNWPRIYRFLDTLVIKLSEPSVKDDPYLATSFFRDISGEGRYLASVTRIDLPHGKSTPGKSYFEPFAKAVLKIAESLAV